MLSSADNDILTRCGPGTPMGELMRQYWIPAVRSDELPGPDSAPVRIVILNEHLIAFRVTSGKVGLIDDACPHRGSSFFFGRNEEEGIRCVYHGWKFDVAGQCVDQMNEPEESNFYSKVKAKVYPCAERGGIVWTYMGPRETPPPLPDLEANMVAADKPRVGTTMNYCNWMQQIENNIDTSHQGVLHHGAVTMESIQDPSSIYHNRPEAKYFIAHKRPKFLVFDTEAGVSYGAYRPAEEDSYYWKMMHFLFPFYTMTPVPPLGSAAQFVATVPVDDYHNMQWNMRRVTGQDVRREAAEARGGEFEGGLPPLPNTTDWLGRFRNPYGPENDFGMDRAVQQARPPTHQGYTGIPGGPGPQDDAMKWSQGRHTGGIVDRSHEHLGNTDSAIIRVRRRLLEAAKALEADSATPPGVDDPRAYRLRSGWIVLPASANFWEETRELREAFKREEPVAVPVGG